MITDSDDRDFIEEDFYVTLSDDELEAIKQEVAWITSACSQGWLEILIDAGWVDPDRHGEFLSRMGFQSAKCHDHFGALVERDDQRWL